MRKIILALLAISLLAPTLALAQDLPTAPTGCTMRGDYTTADFGTIMTCPDQGDPCLFTDANVDCGACCLLDAVYKVSQWVMYIVIIIAFIFIVMGALSIITAGGSPEKVQTGRNYILYAIIGLIIALLAWSLPKIVMSIIGLT
jgi:hypothetical protein